MTGTKAGVQAGPDAMPADRGVDESIIEGVSALPGAAELQGVTGFVLDGFTIWAQSAVCLRGHSHIIRKNIMDGDTFGPTATGQGQFPSGVRSQDFSNVLVQHNNIFKFRYEMNLDGGQGNQSSTVDGNYVKDSRSSSVFFQGRGADGHVVINNHLDEESIGIILTQGGQLVKGNTVENNPAAGIWLVGTSRTSNVQIIGNQILNNGSETLTNADWEIVQSNGVGGVNFAHNNCIEGNEIGVENFDPNNQLDATLNWWGAVDGPSGDGPGSGDSVLENVAF